jgi:tetratricopeptide (TPR) repeat protein/DNA-binding Lrp family transcriptional regulator
MKESDHRREDKGSPEKGSIDMEAARLPGGVDEQARSAAGQRDQNSDQNSDQDSDQNSDAAPDQEIWDDDTSGVFTDAVRRIDHDTLVSRVPYDLQPDYTGRKDVLERLLEIVGRTRTSGCLSFALLIGEPGMGKSRTIKELGRALKKRHPDVRLFTGCGDANGIPYASIGRLLGRRFSITPGLSAQAAEQRILRGVSDVLPSARVTEVAHLLAHLMRVPVHDSPVVGPLASSPQQLETRMFIAMRRFLAADAATSPVVLVLEDLEGCGHETINLLHYLAAGLKPVPVVILGTARASLFERYPSFGEGDVELERVEMSPLGTGDATTLLRDLCRPLDEVPAELDDIARSLGGSPRALLELMRLLLESGVIKRTSSDAWTMDTQALAAIALPHSYPELVERRLEVMDARERELLSMAAVVGETFWLDAVVALVRAQDVNEKHPDGPMLSEIAAVGDESRTGVAAALSRLAEREWIIAVDESSVPGEREYRFAYPHLRSMVLARIPAGERHGYHKTAAQWLELRPEGRRPLVQEEIARHLEQAGLHTEAAARYRRAADQARASYFNSRAIRLYMRALQCIGDRDLAARIHLWHDLGSVYELKGDFEAALGAFERLLRLAWVVAARNKAAVAFNKMGRVWRRKGDLKLALEYLERGAELFELAGDERGIAGSLDDIGQVLYLLGRYDKAHDKITAGLERRSDGDSRSIAMSLSNLGNIQRARGLLAEARARHHEALELRRQIGDRFGVLASLNNIAVLDYEQGELGQARASWVQVLSEAEHIGALPLCALALNNLGELALAEGQRDEARHRLEDALAIADEIEDRRLHIEATRNLALLESALGHSDKAWNLAQRAHEIAAAQGLRDSEARALVCLGRVLSTSLFDSSADESRCAPAAQHYFEQGIALLRQLGNDTELGRSVEEYGRYRLDRGDRDAARELLRQAHAIYSRLDSKRVHKVQSLLDEL